jgi:hypothetical protein
MAERAKMHKVCGVVMAKLATPSWTTAAIYLHIKRSIVA